MTFSKDSFMLPKLYVHKNKLLLGRKIKFCYGEFLRLRPTTRRLNFRNTRLRPMISWPICVNTPIRCVSVSMSVSVSVSVSLCACVSVFVWAYVCVCLIYMYIYTGIQRQVSGSKLSNRRTCINVHGSWCGRCLHHLLRFLRRRTSE